MKPDDIPQRLSQPPQPISIEQQIKTARKDVEKAFKELFRLYESKILVKNKSVGKVKTEKSIVDNLVKRCVSLENLNSIEGLLSLGTISLRLNLKMKDLVNNLEFQIETLKRDVKKLMTAEKDKETK